MRFTDRNKKMNKEQGEKMLSRLKQKRYNQITIYAAFLVIMIITFVCKNNFHVDEICSYTLSNNTKSIMMTFEEGRTYSPSEQIYLDNMTVRDAAEAFNFVNVWKNQTKDVHPPFYYVLLHMICSYGAGRFSLWYAAVINICFALLSLWVLRKLVYLFCQERAVVDLVSILFVLSTGILQNVSFLRMYVMAMFWVTLTAYLFIKAFDEGFSWKGLMRIGLTAIAGALTHYYCIIYLCATCLVFGICLIIQKRWKDMVRLIGCMTISAGFAIAVFPAMLSHMFSGYRGTQSVDNMTQGTMLEHWERIKSFYQFINIQMLGKIGGGGIVFLLLTSTLFIVWKRGHDTKRTSLDFVMLMRWLIIGIPIVLYFIFVSISAAYVADRYLFPIYAVTFGLFLCMMYEIWKKLVPTKYVYIIMCLIGTIFIINGFGNARWDYLYKSSTDLLDKAETYSDKNCIGVYDVMWKEQPAFCEMQNYKSVTFIQQEHYNNILYYGDLFEDGFILNIIGGNDDRIINMIQSNYPYLNRCEKIGEYAYSNTYFISAGEGSHHVQIYNYDKSSVIGADGSDLGSNVLLTLAGQDTWIVMQGGECAVIEMGGMVLDIAGARYADGTNIQMFVVNGTDAQKWRIIANEDGSFSLLTMLGDFALAYGEDGNIYLAEYHEEERSQKWWINSKSD